MEIDQALLEQLTADVLTGMLGMQIAPSQENLSIPAGLMASIRISGDWQAGLELMTPYPSARQVAGQMFALPDEEIGEAELADALGEIANMIGGNLKGLTSGDTSLSLPCVGPLDNANWPPTADSAVELHVLLDSGPLTLRLYEVASQAGSADCTPEPVSATCPA